MNATGLGNDSCRSLPWQGMVAATKKQKYEKISEKKLSTPVGIVLLLYPVGHEFFILPPPFCPLLFGSIWCDNNRFSVYLYRQIELLCEGFPRAFVRYLEYIRNLAFEEKPDYAALKQLFK